MLKVSCNTCNEEVNVNMFFYGADIRIEENPVFLTRTPVASVHGRTTCPNCGEEIVKVFRCPLTASDITDFALRREIHV